MHGSLMTLCLVASFVTFVGSVPNPTGDCSTPVGNGGRPSYHSPDPSDVYLPDCAPPLHHELWRVFVQSRGIAYVIPRPDAMGLRSYYCGAGHGLSGLFRKYDMCTEVVQDPTVINNMSIGDALNVTHALHDYLKAFGFKVTSNGIQPWCPDEDVLAACNLLGEVDYANPNDCPTDANPNDECFGFLPDLRCNYGHIYTGCAWDTLRCSPMKSCQCSGGSWLCVMPGIMSCAEKPADHPFGNSCDPEASLPLPTGTTGSAVRSYCNILRSSPVLPPALSAAVASALVPALNQYYGIVIPVNCCAALTASCFACGSGMTVEEYCEKYPSTTGCEDCCLAKTASCFACGSGMTVEEYCEKYSSTTGCGDVDGVTSRAGPVAVALNGISVVSAFSLSRLWQ